MFWLKMNHNGKLCCYRAFKLYVIFICDSHFLMDCLSYTWSSYVIIEIIGSVRDLELTDWWCFWQTLPVFVMLLLFLFPRFGNRFDTKTWWILLLVLICSYVVVCRRGWSSEEDDLKDDVDALLLAPFFGGVLIGSVLAGFYIRAQFFLKILVFDAC